MGPQLSPADLRDIIEAARGEAECDLVVRGGLVVNVFTGEILRADVGVRHGRIAAVTENGIRARQVVDAENLFLTPGLIDAHIHLESSMLTPAEFARIVVGQGTTAIVIDPHEIASVAGAKGIRELMLASEDLPLTVYVTIPPAVPANDLETYGTRLDIDEMAEFTDSRRVVGIAEQMDVDGVLAAREDVLRKLAAAQGSPIDGHAPGLSGRDLQAYTSAGISSDHECTNTWEGQEKLRAGMWLMIRDGTAAHNLDDLIHLVDITTVGRCVLVTDDLSAADAMERGHINHLLSRVVAHGVGPAQAIRMATLNPALRYGLDRVGAIAPGYVADIAGFDDLADFHASLVIAKGELVAADGALVADIGHHEFSPALTGSVHIRDIGPEDIRIAATDGLVRVIEAVDGSIITRQHLATPTTLAGKVVSDVDNDILKIAVVERHGKSGNVAVGLVSGFGLKAGALASSVAHDAHNIVAVGASDIDILDAIRHVAKIGGGLAAVAGGRVLAELPLPIAGLMSPANAETVAAALRMLEERARELGSTMRSAFSTLSFMCLSVVPELKITDRGLVDVNDHGIVPLFIEEPRRDERAAAG